MLRPFIDMLAERTSTWPTFALAASALAFLLAMASASPRPRFDVVDAPRTDAEAFSRCAEARRNHAALADYGTRGASNCAECHSPARTCGKRSRRGMTHTSRITPATSATSAMLKIGHGLPGQ